jgi:hypothetical protein
VLGHPGKETPALDRMAAEGILFTDFYTRSSAGHHATCSLDPQRWDLLALPSLAPHRPAPHQASWRVPGPPCPTRNGFYQTTFPGRNAYTPQAPPGLHPSPTACRRSWAGSRTPSSSSPRCWARPAIGDLSCTHRGTLDELWYKILQAYREDDIWADKMSQHITVTRHSDRVDPALSHHS